MKPVVSICVPNLNNRPFLPERFSTIFSQTFQDWELIVCDSYSDDGAWEYIQALGKDETRMRISQSPRGGIYAGFNDCIAQARGKFVYIATSDDTMAPDCLDKMVMALEANSDCGLCQCGLTIIDETGSPVPPERQWNRYTMGAYDQNLVVKRNKRLAPHDGFVHPALFTIYTSITQLLIRRTVFERIGLFDGQWGHISDFEWGMRVGFVENCIYIPETLATWRIHPKQATGDVHTVQNRMKMIEMSRRAFSRAAACSGTALDNINVERLVYFLERDIIKLGLQHAPRWKKLNFLLGQLLKHPRAVLDTVKDWLLRRHWGLWHCANRYGRLKRLLRKCSVPAPVFE